MTAIVIIFLLFDGIIKVMNVPAVVDSFTQLGYPADIGPSIGLLLLICLALYILPRTSVLGAVLLTGYLGGAVATNLRVGQPLFGYILFPVYVGALLWGGLYFRNERLRALFPLQKKA